MAFKLWKHQDETADLIVGRDKTLLRAGVGVGKTLTTIVAAQRAKHKKVLVLTIKAALKSVWAKEFKDHAPEFEVIVLDKGTSKAKAEKIRKTWNKAKPQAFVVNYETAKMLPLEDFDWDFAIADESHKLKSHDSQISLNLARSCAAIPHKIAMTGTVWDDRPTDLYGQIRWLDPEPLARKKWGSATFGSWTQFFERYVIYFTIDGHIKVPNGYKNLEDMAARIRPFLHVIERDQVLDLPPVLHQVIGVDLEPSHKDFCEAFETDSIASLGDQTMTAANALVLALRLQQATGGFFTPDGERKAIPITNGHAKRDAVLDIVDTLGNEPFVVFHAFTDELYDLGAALKRAKVSWLQLADGVDQHQDWQQGKAQALLLNISAGSAGINLTRACYGFFMSTGYSRTNFIQAIGRVDRPPQARKVTFYHIQAASTVDVKIAQALNSKRDVAQDLLSYFAA